LFMSFAFGGVFACFFSHFHQVMITDSGSKYTGTLEEKIDIIEKYESMRKLMIVVLLVSLAAILGLHIFCYWKKWSIRKFDFLKSIIISFIICYAGLYYYWNFPIHTRGRAIEVARAEMGDRMDVYEFESAKMIRAGWIVSFRNSNAPDMCEKYFLMNTQRFVTHGYCEEK